MPVGAVAPDNYSSAIPLKASEVCRRTPQSGTVDGQGHLCASIWTKHLFFIGIQWVSLSTVWLVSQHDMGQAPGNCAGTSRAHSRCVPIHPRT